MTPNSPKPNPVKTTKPIKSHIRNSDKASFALQNVLNNPDMSQRNKEIINNFVKKCFAEDLSELKIVKLVGQLKNIVIWLKKDIG